MYELYGGETEIELIVSSFRGTKVPAYIKNKSQLILWALETFRFKEPISNGEFVFELRCTRFGAVLHDLRKEGYDIVTLPAKQKGHYLYYLVSSPKDGDTMKRKGKRFLKKMQKVLT
tara:strand:+ start:130 stop:480 length:351 start_codon:yes stop_codon:yes gene_type:complete